MTHSRISRPDGAPKGIVRAHMATFPARAGVFRRVVEAMLPQVDRMVIVFNEMDEVPADIAADDRIEAITTDRDTKDLGRFFLSPQPDDIVFLLDDDMLYPADYVARSIDSATDIGWDGNVFGYLGMNLRGGEARGWQVIRPSDRLDAPQGVRMLGTGTVVARGDAIPPFSAMAPYWGHSDVGFALLNQRARRRAWALPRAERWLRSGMRPELEATRLSRTLRLERPLPMVAAIAEIIGTRPDHVDGTQAGVPAAGQEVT